MSYLGRSAKLSLKAQEKVSFLATAGQTVKTGLSYTPSFVEVYVNGVLLTDTTDFTATNGNSITFTVALLLNDEVTVISLKTFTVADHYTKSDADTLLAAKATNTALALKAPIASPVFTGNVGVGETSPAANLHLGASSPHIDIGPSGANRGKIGFNSNNVYIGSTSGAGEIHFKNNISSNDAPNSSGDTKMVIADSAVIIGNGVTLGNGNTYAAANTLSDYEEGTFIPAVRGSTNAGSFSTDSSGHIGRYTKIGDICSLSFVIAGTLSGATGSYTQFNLPFTVKAGTAATGTFSYVLTPNLNHLDFSSYVIAGQTLGYFLIKTGSAATPVYPAPSSFMPAGVQIYGTVTYTVA